MKKILTPALLIATVFILANSCKSKQKVVLDCSSIPASYNSDIKPILERSCFKCHGAGSSKGDFSTYEGLKTVAANGELEEHVLIKQDMPKSGPLPEEERKKIRCWLNNGFQNN